MKRRIYLLFILCLTSPTTISGKSSIHFCLLVSIYSVVRLKNIYIIFIFPQVFLKCKVPLLSKRNLFLAIAYFAVIAFLSWNRKTMYHPLHSRRWNSDSAAGCLNNFNLTIPKHISSLNVGTSQFIVKRKNFLPKTNRIFNIIIKRRAGQNLLFLTLSQ